MHLPQLSLVLGALLSILTLTTANPAPLPNVAQMAKGRLQGRISTPYNVKKFRHDYLTTTTCHCAADNGSDSSNKVDYYQWEYYNRRGDQTFLMHYNVTTNSTSERPRTPVCRTYKIIPDRQYKGQHWKDEFCYIFDEEGIPGGDFMTLDRQERFVGKPEAEGRKQLSASVANERCKILCPEFMKTDKTADASLLVAHQKIKDLKLKAWKEEEQRCDEDYGC